MSCFCTSQTDTDESCCNANNLCSFSGNLEDVVSTPIYVQSVYDAVRFNLQGMKTIQGLRFSPSIPCGCSLNRIVDIRCKKVYNPDNASDCDNLTLDMETGLSGACFVNNCNGIAETIGPDGVPSEKILFADTSDCDNSCKGGTPIFGTQNVRMWGNIIVYLDLALCDNCGRESIMTVCAEVNIAKPSHPLVLTNFFELCMPSTSNSAFLPRLTELSNAGFTARLATNNCTRDTNIGPGGELCANLIIRACIVVEKKITVPVQLCVLATGFAEAPLQENNDGIFTCPGLFPERTDPGSNASPLSSGPGGNSSISVGDQCSIQQNDNCGYGCGDYPPPTCR